MIGRNRREKRKVYSGDKSILKGKLDEMKAKLEDEIVGLQEKLEEMDEDEDGEKRSRTMESKRE